MHSVTFVFWNSLLCAVYHSVNMAASCLRVVCISDTHNKTVSLPPGDILIHAGDLTNRGSQKELLQQLSWISKAGAKFSARIVVAGNHDLTLDREWYEQYGKRAHNNNPQDLKAIQTMIQEDFQDIIFLYHQHVNINVNGYEISIFGSPMSRRSGEIGDWAFGYEDGDEATSLWNRISKCKSKIDILVVHGPPKGFCDIHRNGHEDGCEVLLETIRQIKPGLVVCGHRHEGRGCVLVEWECSNDENSRRLESWTWVDDADGTSKKGSLVDLTGKGKGGTWTARKSSVMDLANANASASTSASFQDYDIPDKPHISTLEATGRWTCIVNAAITRRSFQPRQGSGTLFNKPIVVSCNLGAKVTPV